MEGSEATAGLGGLRCRGKKGDLASWVTRGDPSRPDSARVPLVLLEQQPPAANVCTACSAPLCCPEPPTPAFQSAPRCSPW